MKTLWEIVQLAIVLILFFGGLYWLVAFNHTSEEAQFWTALGTMLFATDITHKIWFKK